MERILRVAFVLSLVMPHVAVAGGTPSTPPVGAPALGQPGLILLGVALAGTGLALLRFRRK